MGIQIKQKELYEPFMMTSILHGLYKKYFRGKLGQPLPADTGSWRSEAEHLLLYHDAPHDIRSFTETA